MESAIFVALSALFDILASFLLISLTVLVGRKRATGVLIASADAKLRKRWRQPLQVRFSIKEISEYNELRQSITDLNPAVLLLDLAFPKLGGVEGLSAIRSLRPSTKIVLFTSIPDVNEAVASLKAGAMGYCTININQFLIKKAVETVLKGEVWAARNLIHHLVKELSVATPSEEKFLPTLYSGFSCLRPREREIARMIGNGDSNKEIACRLKITEATVKAHLTSIFRSLGFSSRVHLALLVERNRAAFLLQQYTSYFSPPRHLH